MSSSSVFIINGDVRYGLALLILSGSSSFSGNYSFPNFSHKVCNISLRKSIKITDFHTKNYQIFVNLPNSTVFQVEYSHPQLDGSGDAGLPDEWHLLPSLALPDGVHNCQKDTIFFLLPSREEPGKCVFGISCYRQIDAKVGVSRIYSSF